MPATPAWLAAVETVLNRSIAQSIKARAAAARLDHTSLEVHIEGLQRIRAAVGGGRLALTSGGGLRGAVHGELEGGKLGADAVISGSPLALFELFTGRLERAGAGAGAGRGHQRPAARVEGDAEIAARYRELIGLARPDLEEELARLIGDVPARRVSLGAQAALSWARGFARTAGANLAEYLQEESRDLVNRTELEEFLAGVDQLRETQDRVEARLARLEQRLKDRA
jgi:ubiquinone biosynthesis protein UbiJ